MPTKTSSPSITCLQNFLHIYHMPTKLPPHLSHAYKTSSTSITCLQKLPPHLSHAYKTSSPSITCLQNFLHIYHMPTKLPPHLSHANETSSTSITCLQNFLHIYHMPTKLPPHLSHAYKTSSTSITCLQNFLHIYHMPTKLPPHLSYANKTSSTSITCLQNFLHIYDVDKTSSTYILSCVQIPSISFKLYPFTEAYASSKLDGVEFTMGNRKSELSVSLVVYSFICQALVLVSVVREVLVVGLIMSRCARPTNFGRQFFCHL